MTRPRSRLTEPLTPLAEGWRARVSVPRRRALAALVALVGVAALLFARQGSTRARVAAALALALALTAVFVVRAVERTLWRDPSRIIRRIALGVEPELARRALRALTLLEHDDADTVKGSGTSVELARLHVARSIAALPRARIDASATGRARRFALLAMVIALMAAGLLFVNPWAVVEGGDVLFAVRGVAPMNMVWFEDLDVHARPPDYLHEEERQLRPYVRLALPRGTLLTVHGTPAHAGRRVVLTDGASEVPFVDDGRGRVIARWPLGESVALRVVARFGDVIIEEPEATMITSIPDTAPEVKLEGAPRTIVLAMGGKAAAQPGVDPLDESGDITIRYEATDDHGLREVHLVLRAGTREERRVLARLDGETRFDRGGHILRATDPFLKKSHTPVDVRVEAKDNDPITGPKWGASEAITIIPPDVGEPEALRLEALRALRDAFVDTLGARLGRDVPSSFGRGGWVVEELKAADADSERLDSTLAASYAGVRVPGRLQAMLRGQMRKVREALLRETTAPNATTHAGLVHATERLVLVTDAIVRGLGQRDARDTAKQLADVADDLALGASQMQRTSDPGPPATRLATPGGVQPGQQAEERGKARADAAVQVLEGGARSLVHLGSLGRDLGEIVVADLARVARARKDGDMVHAELAARDLAARLREPDPSFGAEGTSGRAGGESGGGRGTPGDDGEGEGDAEQAFNQAAQELERLAQDHAEEVGKVEQALAGAMSPEEMKQLAEEAKKHAAAVRDATSALPTVGSGSDSWTNKGSAAREHAEAMARALEQGNPADAVTSGHNALEAIDEAKRTAQRERWMGMFGAPDSDKDRRRAEKRLNDARQGLEPEVKWAEERLAELRKKATERKAGELAEDGDEEQKLGERAGTLADKGKDQQALPDLALEALRGAEKAAREAASSLKRGEADKALEQQREAQKQLQIAKEALGSEGNESEKGENGEGDPSSGHADIPKADAHKGPEEFRRRVIKGLGEAASGRQKDAVRRYADGLLR